MSTRRVSLLCRSHPRPHIFQLLIYVKCEGSLLECDHHFRAFHGRRGVLLQPVHLQMGPPQLVSGMGRPAQVLLRDLNAELLFQLFLEQLYLLIPDILRILPFLALGQVEDIGFLDLI